MRIDLASLRMTDGVPFEFSLGKIRYLEPGARVLVVRNARAMTHRYGPGLPITGEWGDARLATGGERLTLATTAGADVVTFSYDDYVPSHGTGKHTARSRVLIDPRSLPDHSDRQNWKLSARPGGTPGR